MDLLLKVVMTTYVITGVLVLFAMLVHGFWKSEKVYNTIYPTFLCWWGITGVIIIVILLLTELWTGNVCIG